MLSCFRTGAVLCAVLAGCAAAPVRSLPRTASIESDVPAAPQTWPAPAGTPAPVDGIHLTPTRYTELLKAEARADACLFPSSNDLKPGAPCGEPPLLKPSSAFWMGAAVGAVVTAAVSGLLIYGAVEIVKAAK